MEEVADLVRRRLSAGEELAVARVTAVEGFSTMPGGNGSLAAIDAEGSVFGGLLGGLGQGRLAAAASGVLGGITGTPTEVIVDIGDKEAVVAGLACGGRVSLVLQPTSSLPIEMWDLLAARAPAALLTWMHEPRPAVVVDAAGQTFGGDAEPALIDEARSALAEGRSSTRALQPAGDVLLEAWVPEPRFVVVGSGELLDAIAAQAALLGWEVKGCGGEADELAEMLRWAGVSGALIVLSHDPHVDVPALVAGLASGTAYVGALGSRNTQSRRTTQLEELGIAASDISRIHRPIGLDLGGRRAPEVALSIVAEVLACHHGRSAVPLKDTQGPIHG